MSSGRVTPLTLAVAALLFAALLLGLSIGHDIGEKGAIEVFRSLSPVYLTANNKGARDYSTIEALNFEVVRVEFYDQTWFQITKLQEHSSPGALDIMRISRTIFKREPAEISRVVHNHPTVSEFSPADVEAVSILENNGFHGEFGLIHKGSLYFLVDR